MVKVQVSACIHQENVGILEAYLDGLLESYDEGLDISYRFALHAPLGYEERMIHEYLPNATIVTIETETPPVERTVECHHWTPEAVKVVATAKDELLYSALRNEADYIFFVDSDTVIQPETIQHLVSLQKPVCAEVLWTRWRMHLEPRPNAWDSDGYKIAASTIAQLHHPGTYRAWMVGGCVMIKRFAIEKGVKYGALKTLSLWGEDRHFSIRAEALGIDMWIDTCYPAFHIYRDWDLDKLEKVVESWQK